MGRPRKKGQKKKAKKSANGEECDEGKVREIVEIPENVKEAIKMSQGVRISSSGRSDDRVNKYVQKLVDQFCTKGSYLFLDNPILMVEMEFSGDGGKWTLEKPNLFYEGRGLGREKVDTRRFRYSARNNIIFHSTLCH